ncbi:MAG: Hsp20/alpha crystallin family protein [Gammaproteobacteria bacterium]
MVVRMRDPFATLAAVQRAMDSVIGSDGLGTRITGGSYPPVNVYKDGEDFVVVAEIPGVRKEDLDIQVSGDTLRIKGKKAAAYRNNAAAESAESEAAMFERVVTLPVQLDVAKVAADYRDGVLTVRLPRAESERPRSVVINA